MTPRRRFSGQRAGRRRASIGSVLIAALLLGGALSILALGRLDEGRLAPACPPGLGRGVWDPGFFFEDDAPARNAAQRLLDNPNFGASPEAAGDLETGIVDERLVAALRDVTREHSICVEAFKKGHYFLPGVPEGPRIPEGYGEAGGLPNTHYFGRAADIRWVDGKPVEGNATDPEVLDVGRILADIPQQRRPDQIIGPPGWTRALGYGREAGWVLDADQLELHEDHLHIGYTARDRTSRRGKALSPGQKPTSMITGRFRTDIIRVLAPDKSWRRGFEQLTLWVHV